MPVSFLIPSYGDRGLSCFRDSTLGSLAHDFPGDPSHIIDAGITGIQHHIWLFTWFQVLKLRHQTCTESTFTDGVTYLTVPGPVFSYGQQAIKSLLGDVSSPEVGKWLCSAMYGHWSYDKLK